MLMKEFLARLKQSPVVYGMVPMEAVPGLPIPASVNGRACVRLLYYTAEQKEGRILLFPPLFFLTAEYPSAKVVQFCNTRYCERFAGVDFGQPAGDFLPLGKTDATRAEYLAAYREYLAAVERRLERMCAGTDPEGGEDGAREEKLFAALEEQPISPYYRMLRESQPKKS